MTKQMRGGVSRRGMLKTGGSAAAVSLLDAVPGESKGQSRRAPTGSSVPVELEVNGRRYRLNIDPRTTLLDVLRDKIGLTGTKKGCDHGQCGACTVLSDGRRVLSCLTLAAAAERASITTIEGLAGPSGSLHPMQQAFIDQDAFQCGYCTPGQILSAVACIAEGHAKNEREIREYMSGNLCRCGAYPNIVAAIMAAKPKMPVG